MDENEVKENGINPEVKSSYSAPETQAGESVQNLKKFTQEDVNALIKKERLKYEGKNYLEEAEFKEFQKYKDEKKTTTEKLTEKQKEVEKLMNQLTEYQHTTKILKSGVNPVYSEFVQFTVGKMQGDFEENLNEFLEKNPMYKQAENKKEEKAVGGVHTGVTQAKLNNLEELLRKRNPKYYN